MLANLNSHSRRQWSKLLLVALGLACLIGLVYANSFQSGFVLDNEFIIKDDPRLRAATWENLSLICTKDYWYPKGVGGLFRPLTTLSFLVEYSLLGFGQNPTYYHGFNLILHLFNATLVFFLMNRLVNRGEIAIGAAALFAVHPIATESVTNLVGRSDLLAAASVLGGTLFYLKSIDTHGYRRWIWLVMMAVSMAAGVLSKESAVVLIGILPLYDLAYRMNSRRILSTKSLEAFWRFFWKGYIVLVPIVVALFAIRYSMQLSHGPTMMAWKDNPMRGTDFLSARFTAVKVIGYYLGLLVFPLKLSCDYTLDAIPNSSWRMSSLEDWKAALAFGLLAALAVVVWFCHRRGAKSIYFLAGWFFIALLPTANVLFLIDSNMAERFLYLPLVAYAGLFALTLNAISQRIHRTGYVVLLGLVISLLGCRTYLRNQDWRSNLTLWTSASKVCPASFRVQRSLAIAMYDQKSEPFDLDAIIDVARKATAITRSLPVEQGDQLSHFFLGMLYGQKADRAATRDVNGSVILTDEVRTIFEQSLSELETAASIGETIESKKSNSMRLAKKGNQDVPQAGPVQVYETLFMVYSRLGRHGDAVKTLRKIQAINPLASRVYRFLPDELILSGNSSEAGVVLIQAFLLHVEHEFAAQQLTSIYAPGNQATQPIVLRDGATLSFDLTNPLLRTDVDAAFAQLIELFLRKKNFVTAEQLMEASVSFQCDPAPLNAVYERLGVKR